MTGGSTSISLIVIGFSPASPMTISPFLLSNDPGPQQESADSGHGRAAPQDAPRPLPANFQVDCVGLVGAAEVLPDDGMEDRFRRDKVSIIVSGGIATAEHVPKA